MLKPHGSLPAPTGRPYRATYADGGQIVHIVRDESGRWFRKTWRQIGWHGQSGALYALGEKPSAHEPGGWSPLYAPIDTDEIEPPEAVADLAAMARTAI